MNKAWTLQGIRRYDDLPNVHATTKTRRLKLAREKGEKEGDSPGVKREKCGPRQEEKRAW